MWPNFKRRPPLGGIETASNADAARRWIANVFATAIARLSRPEDRAAAIEWLRRARAIVGNNTGTRDKIAAINSITSTRATASAVGAMVGETIRNYRQADMPLAVKVALPATLLAAPFLAGHGVGVAALGGAVGAPALLLVFLGTAGITSVIDAVTRSEQARNSVGALMVQILESEMFRRLSREMRESVRARAKTPERQPLGADEMVIREQLLAMNPYDFESHVMSYFAAAGFAAIVTPRSGDAGIDGLVDHPGGAIVVQCKRYAPSNKVGGPEVQQLMGCIQQNNAQLGYLVTTSEFTLAARAAAASWSRVVLIDIGGICAWERGEPIIPAAII